MTRVTFQKCTCGPFTILSKTLCWLAAPAREAPLLSPALPRLGPGPMPFFPAASLLGCPDLAGPPLLWTPVVTWDFPQTPSTTHPPGGAHLSLKAYSPPSLPRAHCGQASGSLCGKLGECWQTAGAPVAAKPQRTCRSLPGATARCGRPFTESFSMDISKAVFPRISTL